VNLKIRLYGDPCLTKKSVPVKEVGPGERMLVQAMIKTMRRYKGIGLAAPQVGINQRLFVADIGEGPLVVVNPKIVRKSGSQVLEEGCLSIPGISVPIERAQKVQLEYVDENNQKLQGEFSDLMARVILHENDHLEGKLILEYVGSNEKEKLIQQFEEYFKKNNHKNGLNSKSEKL